MISEALLSSAGWSCVFGVEIGQDSRTCRGIRSSILWLETQDGGRLPRPGRSMSPVDPLHPPIQEKAHPDHHIQGPQIQGPIDVLFPFLWHLLLLDLRAPMRIWLDGVIPRCKEKGTAGLEQLGSRVFCATIVTLKGPILHLKMSVHHTRRVSQFFCNHDLVSWQILCQRLWIHGFGAGSCSCFNRGSPVHHATGLHHRPPPPGLRAQCAQTCECRKRMIGCPRTCPLPVE